MSRRRIYESDVEALGRRLQGLLAADARPSEDDIAGYEAEREQLLDLIGGQVREQREYDDALRRLRAEMEAGAEHAPAMRTDAEARREDQVDDAELRQVEALINAPGRAAAHGSYGDETDDRDRVLAEAPAAAIGGLWFTPDDAALGGVRSLTETELRHLTDRVRTTQADAIDYDPGPVPFVDRSDLTWDDAADAGRER